MTRNGLHIPEEEPNLPLFPCESYRGSLSFQCEGRGKYRPDPFALEIHDEVKMMVLCNRCWQERHDDI